MAHVLQVTAVGPVAGTGISVPSPAAAWRNIVWLEDFITQNGSRSKKEKCWSFLCGHEFPKKFSFGQLRDQLI